MFLRQRQIIEIQWFFKTLTLVGGWSFSLVLMPFLLWNPFLPPYPNALNNSQLFGPSTFNDMKSDVQSNTWKVSNIQHHQLNVVLWVCHSHRHQLVDDKLIFKFLRIIVITMPTRSKSSIWDCIITIYRSLHQLVDAKLIFNLLRIIVISMPTKSKSSIGPGILIIIDLNLVLTFIPPSPIN